MGYDGDLVKLDGDEFPAKLGRTPWSVPRPFVLDNRAALALGYAPVTSHAQAVRATCNELVLPSDVNWRSRSDSHATIQDRPVLNGRSEKAAVLESGTRNAEVNGRDGAFLPPK